MAVPSSGELELRGDIALEVYGNATGNNISLGTMSDLAGFASPDAMTDFYGYSSASAPSVITNSVIYINTTYARFQGNITSDGGSAITQKGFYYGTNPASPTSNTKATAGGNYPGAYFIDQPGLSPNTTYYVWAFATNAVGTTYGSRTQFTTIQQFNPTYARPSSKEWYTQHLNGTNATTVITISHTMNYINPYTGGLVAYYSNVNGYNQPHNTSAYQTTSISASPGLAMCTNATNRMLNTSQNANGGSYVYAVYTLTNNAGGGTFSSYSAAATFGYTWYSQASYNLQISGSGQGFVGGYQYSYLQFDFAG